MKKTIHDIAKPLKDRVFFVPIEKCEPAKYNPDGTARRFNTRADMGDLDEFAETIRPKGVIVPAIGYMGENGLFQITEGERRWRGLGIVKRKYHLNYPLPVILEDKATTDEDRIFTLLVTATGKPLDMIEQARGIERLLDGLDPKARARKIKELPKRIGKSETHIANCLALLDAPEPIKQAVSRGQMSGTLAADLAHAVPDKKRQVEVLEEAKGKAKAKGKKKITAKLLSVPTGKKAQAAKKEEKKKMAPTAPTLGGGLFGGAFAGTSGKRREHTDTEDETLGKLLDLYHSVNRSTCEPERYETLEYTIDFLQGKETRKTFTEFLLGIV